MDATLPVETVPLWETVPTPDGVTPEEAPSLTAYRVTPGFGGTDPRAAMVILPGGGYGGRSEHEGRWIAHWLNLLGIHGFVVHYRVAPHRHPVPLLDAQRAIRLVRARAEEWGVRADRVGVIGFSAGGHLAATLSTEFDNGDATSGDPVARQGCRPDAAVLGYPVITFEPAHRHHGSMVNLLGGDPPEALRRELSRETRVTSATPPTFLWHSADDGCVPVENSLLYAQALAAAKVPFALHVFPAAPHGVGLKPGLPTTKPWTDLCGAWLRELGF